MNANIEAAVPGLRNLRAAAHLNVFGSLPVRAHFLPIDWAGIDCARRCGSLPARPKRARGHPVDIRRGPHEHQLDAANGARRHAADLDERIRESHGRTLRAWITEFIADGHVASYRQGA